VQEVRNAIVAYDHFEQWQPEVESDLLAAHRELMNGLIDDAGSYPHGSSGRTGSNSDV